MNVKSLIVSLIMVLVLVGLGVGLYCAWPAITGTINDNKYYTAEEVEQIVNEAVDNAFSNKNEMSAQIDYYKELTDEYYLSILDYQTIVSDYEAQVNSDKQTIANLTIQKSELEDNVSNLESINDENVKTITSLNIQIESLEKEVQKLENSDTDKTSQISALNKQISNLQALIQQLQITNEVNNNTITSLNAQIISLNSQISELTYQIQNNGSTVTSLNNKIAQLEESITYYENYIASLESGEQVVATFEFDGSVYNIQILNKNATASVTTPTSTDYVIFNYWTINGEQIDLSTYQFTTNTKVVANVTYKYDVKFMVDNAEYNAQIVTSGTTATVPTEPTKSGYEFDGWSLNGVDIVENISTTAVTQNVTYQAVFTKIHTVTFIYEDDTIDTQTVRNGEYATDVDVEDTTNKIFNGWLLNGAIVDVSTYKILGTTVFTADITYKYNVVFKVDNADYDTQLVVKNGYATTPTAPTKDGYEFDGWSLNGVDIVEPSTIQIIADTTFVAILKVYKYSLTAVGSLPLLPDGTSALNYNVWTDGSTIYYSGGNNKQYILNESYTEWNSLSWNGYSSLLGSEIWSDGNYFYYTNSTGSSYKIDISNRTISRLDWSYRISSINNLVFVGEDIYYFCFDGISGDLKLKFNKETCSWTRVTVSGIPSSWKSGFEGCNIWTDGTNWYWSYSSQQYKINFSTLSLTSVSWNGLAKFNGNNVWTDGLDCYYSFSDEHYILDKDTNTWISIEWKGLTSFFGNNICVYNSNIYIFDDASSVYYKFINLTVKTK